jgi:hypothetical protein
MTDSVDTISIDMKDADKASMTDGLASISNQLINQRQAACDNVFVSQQITMDELRAIYHTGLGNKIVRLKAGGALTNSIQFESDKSKEFYFESLSSKVFDAVKYMIAFGRGAIVVFAKGDDLSKPFTPKPQDKIKSRVFSGDQISASNPSRDLMDDRYALPATYIIKGQNVHHSRVIDFTYVRPPEVELPVYQYGGIPEYELIYPQLVNDGVIERAIGAIVDKNSSLFYKVEGLKEAMRSKRDAEIINYFSIIESMRSTMSATVIDKEDEVVVLAQAMANLSDVDNISLRRLALVTGIPIPYLVGEAVQGLNSAGTNERAIFGDMIAQLQSDYIQRPLQQLFDIFSLGKLVFENTQGITQAEIMQNETIAIDNAIKLQSLGEDHGAYLVEKGIITEEQDDDDDDDDDDLDILAQSLVNDSPAEPECKDCQDK